MRQFNNTNEMDHIFVCSESVYQYKTRDYMILAGETYPTVVLWTDVLLHFQEKPKQFAQIGSKYVSSKILSLWDDIDGELRKLKIILFNYRILKLHRWNK